MSEEKAKKFDSGKPPMALIPPAGEVHEALAMANGQVKYGTHNYLQGGLTALQLLSAAKRHINAFIQGEEIAADSGVHHLGHARACLGMLLQLQALGTLVDDRFKST